MKDLKEKLIEILGNMPASVDCIVAEAEYLIANGVTLVEPPKHRKMLCAFWNPGHHGSKQRCEQLTYKPCSCNGDVDKCDYRGKR